MIFGKESKKTLSPDMYLHSQGNHSQYPALGAFFFSYFPLQGEISQAFDAVQEFGPDEREEVQKRPTNEIRILIQVQVQERKPDSFSPPHVCGSCAVNRVALRF